MVFLSGTLRLPSYKTTQVLIKRVRRTGRAAASTRNCLRDRVRGPDAHPLRLNTKGIPDFDFSVTGEGGLSGVSSSARNPPPPPCPSCASVRLPAERRSSASSCTTTQARAHKAHTPDGARARVQTNAQATLRTDTL